MFLTAVDLSVLRRMFLLCPLLFAFLLFIGFFRFPFITGGLLPEIAFSLVMVSTVSVVMLIGIRFLGGKDTALALIGQWGGLLGIAMSLLWISYILFTHLALALPAKATTGALLTILVMSLSGAAFIIVSLLGAWHSLSFLIGWKIGWYGGLIAGIASTFTMLVMLLVGMDFLVQYMNPGEFTAFQQSGWNNRESWYFWQEEVVGAFGYFLVLLIGGGVFGGVGSLIGKVLSTRRNKNTQIQQGNRDTSLDR